MSVPANALSASIRNERIGALACLSPQDAGYEKVSRELTLFLFCSMVVSMRFFAKAWASPCHVAALIEHVIKAIPSSASAVSETGFSDSTSGVAMRALRSFGLGIFSGFA